MSSGDTSTRGRFLILGGGEGWHATQLRHAAARLQYEIAVTTYESLRGDIGSSQGVQISCDAGRLSDFDAILTRTMPAGTLEQITFRLATLHGLSSTPMVNPPRALEIAIDKFATLGLVAELGYAVPETIVVQSRREAIDAFGQLGGDCVVKPIFGGEGRGVMRIQDAELAWYTFSTLEQLGAIAYVQRFVPPGGSDTRLLVIGDQVLGMRRDNPADFRTNVGSGGRCQPIQPSADEITLARQVAAAIGLKFAAVDLLRDDSGIQYVLEVNAIPGWKAAQRVCHANIAEQLIGLLSSQSDAARPSPQVEAS